MLLDLVDVKFAVGGVERSWFHPWTTWAGLRIILSINRIWAWYRLGVGAQTNATAHVFTKVDGVSYANRGGYSTNYCPLAPHFNTDSTRLKKYKSTKDSKLCFLIFRSTKTDEHEQDWCSHMRPNGIYTPWRQWKASCVNRQESA